MTEMGLVRPIDIVQRLVADGFEVLREHEGWVFLVRPSDGRLVDVNIRHSALPTPLLRRVYRLAGWDWPWPTRRM